MKGKVRVPLRNLACPKCGDCFEDIGKKGYVCPNCLTVPDRYYLDIHFRGKRVRVFCDKQGVPLDSYERAFDLLAHINYEIGDHSFDPTRYVRSEQKEFYVMNLCQRFLDFKIASIAPSYQKDYRRMINIAKDYFKTTDIRDLQRKIYIINFKEYLEKTFKLSGKSI